MSSITNDAASARAAQIPQFLNKLLAMVDDPSTDRFIKWSDDGTSFYVFNPDQFAKELLGTYYKTDASASFVRQLNMYGFHKVPHVRQGALKTDKQAQAWHYRNDNFRRGRPDLLPFITRKGKSVVNAGNANPSNLALQSIKQPDNDGDLELLSNNFNANIQSNTGAEITRGSPKNIDMNQIINGLATIKRHQTLISDNLKELQSSNQALWQEAMEARERHRKHQDTINRILKFLASLFQGTSSTPIRSNSMNGSDAGTPIPTVPRGRLLITDGKHADEENDDLVSTPKSSIRMEEVEDEQSISGQGPTVETPKSGIDTPKVQTQNGFSAVSPSQYPFPDSSGTTPNTYIPPADTWKMLQWLQQNQIPIPGVTYPIVNPQTHNGALATVPPAGMNINPLAFGNMFANSADMSGLSNPTASYNPTGATPNWTNAGTYNPAMLSNGQAAINALGLPYTDNNQLFNSFLPLANVASEPPPSVSVEQVSQRTDKLDQLSTSVEAMQQGIDSLIQGMGLDPLSAASLQVGADPAHAISNTQPGIPLSGAATTTTTTTTNGMSSHGNGPSGQAPEPMYPMDPLDFDLDALLKHIGEKAAGNTPPADYTSLAGDSTFHPLFFDNPSGLDANGAAGQHHVDPTTTTNNVFDSIGRASSVTTGGMSESPVSTRRDISVEPGIEGSSQFDLANSADTTSMVTDAGGNGGRQRNKKRKLEDNSAPVAPPQRQASSGGTRSTKRRK